MMVDFRPHTLRLMNAGGGSYDSARNWVETEGTPSDPIPCRYEPNGAARTINLPDGTAYRYSYVVYLDVDPSLVIKYGDRIELTSQDGVVIGVFMVYGFHRAQLDMKIWV